MKKSTFISILIFLLLVMGCMFVFSNSANAQLGQLKYTLNPQFTCVPDSTCKIYQQDNCIIQTIQDELVCYNFEKGICTSIVLFSPNKESKIYEEILECFHVEGNHSTGTEINFSRDLIIYKLYVDK